MKSVHMIGSHVSTSARTPKIINEISQYLNLKLNMVLHDIASDSALSDYLSTLLSDKDWTGTFITNPLKSKLHLKSNLTISAKQPINLDVYNILSKHDDNFELINTDYLALKSILCNYDTTNVIVFGNGSMYSVISYLLNNMVDAPIVSCICRNPQRSNEYEISDYKLISSKLRNCSLFVNATPCGSLGRSPFPSNINFKDCEPMKCRVLDLVHTHGENHLKKTCRTLNLDYQSGIYMNNLQAYYGIKHLILGKNIMRLEEFLQIIKHI